MENSLYTKRQAALNVCGCGKLHFTYGSLTLHFEREEFLAFAEVVNQLAAQFRYIKDDPSSVDMSSRIGTFCH